MSSSAVPFRTAASVQQERADRDWKNQQDAALAQIRAKYRDLAPGIAIDKMIVELVSRFFGAEPGTMLVTLDLFEMARDENPSEFRSALAHEAPELQREKVIDEIAQLLSPISFQAERIRLSGMSRESLIKRRDEIKLKQALLPHSAAEIRQGIEDFRKAHAPKRVVLPYGITVEKIRASSAAYIKFLNRKYGVDVVNDRIFGRS